MSFVGVLVMNLSGKMIKETTAQYQREQAMLFAKSYTEYAVMAVMSNDRSTNCLYDISGSNVQGYSIKVHIAYIGSAETINYCTGASIPSNGRRILSNDVNTTNTSLNIIVDVYVKYKDFDSSNANWITYHKRTLQKI